MALIARAELLEDHRKNEIEKKRIKRRDIIEMESLAAESSKNEKKLIEEEKNGVEYRKRILSLYRPIELCSVLALVFFLNGIHLAGPPRRSLRPFLFFLFYFTRFCFVFLHCLIDFRKEKHPFFFFVKMRNVVTRKNVMKVAEAKTH